MQLRPLRCVGPPWPRPRPMGRARRLTLLGIALTCPPGNQPAAAQEAHGLESLLAYAGRNHPRLAAARAATRTAEGAVQLAGTLPYNPELTFRSGPRQGADTTTTDFELGLTQRIQIGGQRGFRVDIAEHGAAAATFRLSRVTSEVAAGVKTAYARAITTREQVAVATEVEQLAVQMLAVAQTRLAGGSGTQLESNVAAASMARSRRNRLLLESRYESAQIALATAAGYEASIPIEPAHALPPIPEVLGPDSLLALAWENRGDVRAAEAITRGAIANISLEDRNRWPDPSLGLAVGEEGDERVARLGIAVSIPLFNRNQGQRVVATAEHAERAAELELVRREMERSVRDAFQAFQKARMARDAFNDQALQTTSENLDLARRSFEAGKLNLAEFSAFRRDLLDTEISFLDSTLELYERFFALELAVAGEVISR